MTHKHSSLVKWNIAHFLTQLFITIKLNSLLKMRENSINIITIFQNAVPKLYKAYGDRNH